MEWIQVLTIILAIFGMFLWNVRETKDFHARLCKLEEKYYQIDRRK